MRKVWTYGVWIVLALSVLLLPPFLRSKSALEPCHEIAINITDSLEVRFVDRDLIFSKLHAGEPQLLGLPLSGIATAELESRILEIPAVRRAEAYKTSDGVLHVEVEQRQPLARLIYPDGSHLYLDEEGRLIPAQSRFSSRVLVVNGALGSPQEIFRREDVATANPLMLEILELVRYIHNDPLWKAQIEQIYVNEKKEFELIPRLGAHQILLGKARGYQEKMQNLLAFYQQAIPKLGWNTYEVINLKYEGQIVCTKR